MSARSFISFMLILMVLTSVLLAFTKHDQAEPENNQCPAGTSQEKGTQVQTDGSMILESVSRHLLSAVQ